MENKTTCPRCGKTISNNPVVDSTADYGDSGPSSVNCVCRGNDYLLGINNPNSRNNNPSTKLLKMDSKKDSRR
jgi:hypothetical protein